MSTFLNFFPREKYIRKLVEALITQDDYSEYDENDGDDGDDSGGVGDDDDYQGKLIEAGYAEKPGWGVKSIATSEEQNVLVKDASRDNNKNSFGNLRGRKFLKNFFLFLGNRRGRIFFKTKENFGNDLLEQTQRKVF